MNVWALLSVVLATGPSLQIQAEVGDGRPQLGWAYATHGQAVTLRAVLSGAKARDFHWYKIEPNVGAIDNTSPRFHFEKVPYVETEIDPCRGKPSCIADVISTRIHLPAQLSGVGTMAFRVEATTTTGDTVSTPGTTSIKYGGLTQEVFRVTVRRDDSLVGYATELVNTPYIFGSAGPDGQNQSDLLIGSDCADFIVYARRRSGMKATYTSSYEIDRQAPPLRKGETPRVGDVVHFPHSRHVALLFEDREPIGVVDENDLIFHTCWAPPTVQRLGDTPCSSRPYRVLRFPSGSSSTSTTSPPF